MSFFWQNLPFQSLMPFDLLACKLYKSTHKKIWLMLKTGEGKYNIFTKKISPACLFLARFICYDTETYMLMTIDTFMSCNRYGYWLSLKTELWSSRYQLNVIYWTNKETHQYICHLISSQIEENIPNADFERILI